jgi:hypothetical protein
VGGLTILAQASGAVDTLAPYAQVGGQGVIVAILALVGRRMADGQLVPRGIAERERQFETLVAQGVALNDGIAKLLEASSRREDRLTEALRESNLLAGRLSAHIERLDDRLEEDRRR